jgi:hypothetical protein
MTARRIGSTLIHSDGAALIVHCPALRSLGPALMLALFGSACVVIAFASFAGLAGSGGGAASLLLAFAFAGVFVLPLMGIGVVFIAIALWHAFNALTVATAAGELRMERRWCGILIMRKTVAVTSISALDCVRAARFTGIFGGGRHYRLLARVPGGVLPLADHLHGTAESAEARQLFVETLGRDKLADAGRRDDLADTARNPPA